MIPHHSAVRTVLIVLSTQGLGCMLSSLTSARTVEAFAALGSTLSVFVAASTTGAYVGAGRRCMCGALLVVWSLRLSAYLYIRNIPPNVPLKSLAISRTLWSCGASLPVVLLFATVSAPDSILRYEWAAAVLAVVFLVLEHLADAEKWIWHCDNRSNEAVVTSGVWSLSRHANLAGEGLFHVALCVLCIRGA